MKFFNCLMVTGGTLDDLMRNKLYQVGRDMLNESKSSKSFKTKTIEGLVKSDGKHVFLGSINGIVCDAEVETKNSVKKITVRYIMSKPFATDEIIQAAKWVSLEDLMEEVSNSKSSNYH